jgi:DNA polymerase elongation subunit (family B)
MNQSPVEFQIINWYTNDIEMENSDSEDDEEQSQIRNQDNTKYIMKVFGVNDKGQSVSVSITGFTPHFYVKVDKLWSKMEIDKLIVALRNRMGYRFQITVIDVKPIRKKDFWGFTNKQDFWYLRLCFESQKAMRTAARQISSPKFFVTGIYQRSFKLYESNIEPFLRFAHIKNIQPAGWIRIPAGKYRQDDILKSKCEIDISTKWQNVESVDKQAIAPILIASFDLECNSSDGDFPVAAKDYKRFAIDIFNMFNDKKSKTTDTYETKKNIINYFVEQFEKKQVLSKVNVQSESLREILTRELDHICTIVKGDPRIMRNAFKEKFQSNFTKPTKQGELCLEFYDKIRADTITLTALRRAMNTWLIKCFERNYEIFDRKDNQEIEDSVEDLIKLLLCDKDGIITVATNYLNDKFPPLKGDEIIQIGTTFHRYGETECNRKVMLSLGTCSPIEGIEVIECEDEEDLILNWTQLINDSNPDVITGYNIFGFDFDYIYERAKELGIMREFCKIGRLIDTVSKYKVAKLSSSALGDNLMKYVEMEGRTLIDLMKVVQRDHKLDSYKLDNVANHFMNMNKHDVSPQDIFRLFKGSADDRAIIADYCIQDCALCNKLIMKLEIIANNVGMANVCSVPMSWIFMRGQGVKIFSLVAKECKNQGFLVPTISKPYMIKKIEPLEGEEVEPPEEGYEGAIVLEPKTGIYIDTPISILDYASLYPSSMISENLSHDCMVLEDKYDNLPGVNYLDIPYDLYENTGDEKKKVGEKICRFVQPSNDEKGIIPNILMHLLKNRKLTRKKIGMKRIILKSGKIYEGFYGKGNITTLDGDKYEFSEEDVELVEDVYNSFQKAVLDGLQNAYKVTANSLYGQIGAKTSPIYLKDIAACTTATGRKMIMLAKDYVEKEYGAEVIYGDSVTKYTPTILRIKGLIVIETMDKLSHYGNDKWEKFKEDGKEEKEYCELDGVEVWTDDGWTKVHRVIRHLLAPHKKIIRVHTHTGIVDVTDDHSLLTPDNIKISPKDLKVGDSLLHSDYPICDLDRSIRLPKEACLLNASYKVREEYWIKYHGNTNVLYRTTQLSAQILSMLASSLGFTVSYELEEKGVYKISYSVNRQYHDRYVIKSMCEIPYKGFVYDLTTDNHHFAVGLGKLIGHNTDSIFISFPKQLKNDSDNGVMTGTEALSKSISMGIKSSDSIKHLLKPPHDLEYEKCFFPMILFSKKRYCANKYEHDINKFKQVSMGIVLKRRDNANIVKKIYGGIIDIILNKHDVKASIRFLKDSLQDLISGKYPLEDMVITKTLKARYKDPDKIAHKVLAERIKERSPGSAPQVNDRIPFAYVQVKSTGKEKVLQGNRIEHPEYITEKKLKLDYEFYLTNQIMNPVLQLYALILEQLEGYKLPINHWQEIKKKLVDDGKSEKKIRERLADLREIEVKKLLFDPILLKLAHMKTGQTQITSFFKTS